MNSYKSHKTDKYTRSMRAATEFCDITLSNYNKWLFSMIDPHLGKKVFELGAGTGRFTRLLLKKNLEQLLLLESSPLFYNEILKITQGCQGIITANSDIEHFNDSDLFESFDSIICIQVLEHIKDDVAAIMKAITYLRPGGKFICQVPAMKWLFGHWDRQIGHFRRYTKSDMIRIAESTGLTICESYYFNMVGIFGWWLNFCARKKDFRVNSESRQLNTQGACFDKWVVPIVSRLESFLRPPVGIGLHFVLEKSLIKNI